MSNLSLVLRLALVVLVAYLVVDLGIEQGLGELPLHVELLLEFLILAPFTVVVGWVLVVAPLRRVAAREVERQLFDQRLHRALEMGDSEAECHEVAQRALAQLGSGSATEMLLADSSEAHLKQVLPDVGSEVPTCGVVSPEACPAVRRAQIQEFRDDSALDCCAHLVSSGMGSAVCAPVNVVGRSIGVIVIKEPPEEMDSQVLEAAAGQIGGRLGLLRVMEKAHLQAATDPLTGLLNRRSLENEARRMLARGDRFALVYADLDHFKVLNDVHGHDRGDHALRLFARTLARAVRQSDAVARFGGEEFVMILADRDAQEAVDVLERVQAQLIEVISEANLPEFTASFGVTTSQRSGDLGTLLQAADSALLAAKRAGRNQILVADLDNADQQTADGPSDRPAPDARHADARQAGAGDAENVQDLTSQADR